MREQTDVLAAEFYALTGGDPDASFTFAEPKSDGPKRKTIDGRDVDELRKKWGEGPEAAAGQAAALATSRN